ncbi:glutaredoxin [Periconia macrospinosa]|uniref:Glutaredoxin n=1 Tax=Periconia macrospinosa TaxID=97972 RepID=A0A2V1DYP3_9PLEO|nr:glutaredoxin [Periconia macrospinosa]
MPSQRRMRVTGLVIVLVIVITLYMTTSASRTQNSAFYVKTQEALQAKEYSEATKQRDADDARARLKVAEKAAKKSADEKHQKYLESVGGGGTEIKGKSVGGGKFKVQLPDNDERKKNVPGVATVGGRPRDKEAAKEPETQEDHEIETELNDILKKSPIIIFSKSYCPHSAKAKHILLEKYNIVPAPYVVELDQHPLGSKLQETLANKTGRRTVPNVLVLGKSIGGGSEMEELDDTDKLIDTVRGMGGSRVTEASRKDPQKEMRRKRVMRV